MISILIAMMNVCNAHQIVQVALMETHALLVKLLILWTMMMLAIVLMTLSFTMASAQRMIAASLVSITTTWIILA